jgi:hypothetical protein
MASLIRIHKMVTLLTLPREIIHRVFYSAPQASRKQLRLASSPTGEIGRRWVFESARIAPLKSSCEKFRSILDNPELAACVTKVYIDTVRPADVCRTMVALLAYNVSFFCGRCSY